MDLIDMTGRACPMPVVEAKKALALPQTQGIIMKVDNMIAVQNLDKMAISREYLLSHKEANGIFEVTIQKDAEIQKYGRQPPAQSKVENGHEAQPLSPKNLVVVIGSDTLGSGEEELGKILMKSFIYSLAALDDVPSAVIFMNRGAYLTAEGSNTVSDLKTLEEKGAEILTCGTCSNYYKLTDSIEVGSMIDMYGIVERMARADSIVNM